MAIDSTPRPYDPAQDPANPVATPPHWSVRWGTLILVGLSAFITALLANFGVFKTDPVQACLVAAVPAFGAVLNQLRLNDNQTRKELESIRGAKEIGLVKAKGDVEVAKIEASGEVNP